MTENTASTEDTFSPDVSTIRNDELHRYELRVGGKLAVESASSTSPGMWTSSTPTRTAKFKGQGLAKVLAHFALDDVVAAGKRIIPHCPFIYRYLSKHDAYDQFIDWPEQPPAGA